ncbi:hypothetical protein BD560DRAFT_428332 [Blakeslea trispora]|nr:hypothetical protein BD560DRAFT_428332 [Blakeslea trispora]
MIHWGHGKHFICPVHSSDRRVPTNSGPAVDLQWDFTITFVQRTPNCCTNNRRPPLNLAAVDVLLSVVVDFADTIEIPQFLRNWNSNKKRKFKPITNSNRPNKRQRLPEL